MAWPLRDKTCIVGVGETEYTKWGGIARPEFQLALEAILKAVDDAGLDIKDVDGLVTYAQERSEPVAVAQALGLREVRYAGLYPGGGNAACGVVHDAAMALYSETADIVVCYRSRCQGQFGRSSSGVASGVGKSDTVGGIFQFTAPFGLIAPASVYAFEARRHMHEYGTTSRHFGAIAVASYRHAQQNPRAVMYGRPITLDDHQASRMIADPYRLYDCCQESDGACAVVVTRADRARSLKQRPVYITGAALGNGTSDGLDRTRWPDTRWTSAGLVQVAESLYRRAGLGPADIDVAQFYENFTGQVLMAIEDFGFCKRGEGGPFIEGGRIEWPDGDLPLNTSGGNLAEGFIHGLSLVVEGARQMRGQSTAQVADAETCLVVGGPSAPPHSALVLRAG